MNLNWVIVNWLHIHSLGFAIVGIDIKHHFLIVFQLSKPLHLYIGLVHKHSFFGIILLYKSVAKLVVEPNTFSRGHVQLCTIVTVGVWMAHFYSFLGKKDLYNFHILISVLLYCL